MDICIRATRKGWSIILDPSLEARHVGAGSSGSFSKKSRWLKAWNMTWAHLRIVYKYVGPEAARKVAERIKRQNTLTALKYTMLMNFKKKIPPTVRVDVAQKYLRGDPWWCKPHLPQSLGASSTLFFNNFSLEWNFCHLYYMVNNVLTEFFSYHI